MQSKFIEDYYFFQTIKDYCSIVSFTNGMRYTRELNEIKIYNNLNINNLTIIANNIKEVINILNNLKKEMVVDIKRATESIEFLNKFYEDVVKEINSCSEKDKNKIKTSNIDKRRKNMIKR